MIKEPKSTNTRIIIDNLRANNHAQFKNNY